MLGLTDGLGRVLDTAAQVFVRRENSQGKRRENALGFFDTFAAATGFVAVGFLAGAFVGGGSGLAFAGGTVGFLVGGGGLFAFAGGGGVFTFAGGGAGFAFGGGSGAFTFTGALTTGFLATAFRTSSAWKYQTVNLVRSSTIN